MNFRARLFCGHSLLHTKVDIATCFGLYTTVLREVTVGPGKLLDCFCSVTVQQIMLVANRVSSFIIIIIIIVIIIIIIME